MSLDNRTALFRLPIELRWRDLDAFNHVNNSNFMTYLEEARIRWFESLGEPWMSETFAPLVAVDVDAMNLQEVAHVPAPAVSGQRSSGAAPVLDADSYASITIRPAARYLC